MQLNPVNLLVADNTGVKKQRSIRLLVVIEVRCYEPRSEGGPKLPRGILGIRQSSPQAVLGPQARSGQGNQEKNRFCERGTQLHRINYSLPQKFGEMQLTQNGQPNP